MTEQTADRGNLIGFLNRSKQPGDERPVFQGGVTLPGQTVQRAFALWAHTSERTGGTVLTGRAGDSPQAQVEKLMDADRSHDTDTAIALEQRDGAEALKIDPHSILMFTNRQKGAEHQTRPDYWGYYNPGGGQPLMRVAAWARNDRNGSAMITGSVQVHEPRREKEAEVAPAVPEPANRRARGRDR